MALVMHLRQQEPRGQYTLIASVEYEEHGQVDQKRLEFSLPENDKPSSETGADE
jgi:hypothetical protein